MKNFLLTALAIVAITFTAQAQSAPNVGTQNEGEYIKRQQALRRIEQRKATEPRDTSRWARSQRISGQIQQAVHPAK